jgi:zinc protease
VSASLAAGLSPRRAVLDNGAVVLAQANHSSPVVAINATFAAGSVNDPARLPGVAYLVRRTIDRGTEKWSGSEIAEMLDDRGVSLWISAARHSFSIACMCLSEDFEAILDVMAAVARTPVFPADEIDRRRLQAITSLREAQDDPSAVAIDLLHEDLYGAGHPYGRPVKGTIEGLEGAGRHDLVEFHARHLLPGRLRLAVAGDLPPQRAIDEAARVFGDWRGGAAPADLVLPPPRRGHRSLRYHDMPGKVQTDIGYGFTAIRRLDPRYYAFWIMNNVLGQFGLGGRLADNIRERQGMAYYAYSTLEAMVGEGPLVVRAGVDPANIDRAIDAIDAEVRALGTLGPTVEEVEDSRASLIGSIPRTLETNEGIAEFLLHAELFGLGLDYDRRLAGLLQSVTLDQVREAAAEVLDPDRAAVTVAGPPVARVSAA